MKYILSVLTLLICLSGCQQPDEPSVRSVTNVDIKTVNKDLINLTADMVIHNPNAFALQLSQADLKAYVDDVEIATIIQQYDTEMPAQSDFNMPIDVKMDLKKLYGDEPIAAIGKALQVMADRKLDVRFKGIIKAGSASVKLTIPVDQVEQVVF